MYGPKIEFSKKNDPKLKQTKRIYMFFLKRDTIIFPCEGESMFFLLTTRYPDSILYDKDMSWHILRGNTAFPLFEHKSWQPKLTSMDSGYSEATHHRDEWSSYKEMAEVHLPYCCQVVTTSQLSGLSQLHLSHMWTPESQVMLALNFKIPNWHQGHQRGDAAVQHCPQEDLWAKEMWLLI